MVFTLNLGSVCPIQHLHEENRMHIQINTGRTIGGDEALSAYIRSLVEDALGTFKEHITRVEVHLSDEDGAERDRKVGQNDKRCMMEARLEGCNPLAVTAHADTLHQSVDSAASKLARLIASTLGRLHNRRPNHNGVPTLDEITPLEAE